MTRIKKRYYLILSGLIILLILVVVNYIFAKRQLEKLELKVKKIGVVIDKKGIVATDQARYKKANAVNKKFAYALSLIKKANSNQRKSLPSLGGSVSFLNYKYRKNQVEDINKYVEENEDFFKAISNIKNFENVFFEKAWIPWRYREILNNTRIVPLTRLFSEKIEYDINNNDAKVAMQSLIDCYRLQNLLGNKYRYIYNWSYIYSSTIWLMSVNRVINNFNMSNKDIDHLIYMLREREKSIRLNLIQMFRSETFNFYQYIENDRADYAATKKFWEQYQYNGRIYSGDSFVSLGIYFGSIFEKKAFLLDILTINSGLISFNDYSKVEESWDLFSASRKNRILGGFGAGYIDFHKTYKDNLNAVASIRCTKVALAVMQYRKNNGKYPRRMLDLVSAYLNPEELINPWTGQLFNLSIGMCKVKLFSSSTNMKYDVEQNEKCICVYTGRNESLTSRYPLVSQLAIDLCQNKIPFSSCIILIKD